MSLHVINDVDHIHELFNYSVHSVRTSSDLLSFCAKIQVCANIEVC